jgi:hypothetical protein
MHHGHQFAERVGVDIEDVACLSLLGDHQSMADGLRKDIKEGQNLVVLVQLEAGRLATNDHGKDILWIVGAVQAHGLLLISAANFAPYRCTGSGESRPGTAPRN